MGPAVTTESAHAALVKMQESCQALMGHGGKWYGEACRNGLLEYERDFSEKWGMPGQRPWDRK